MKQLRTKAFTLVELLLLIAVVAFLAATILPMLAGSQKSNGVSCMNSQKQIALGLAIWGEDNGDYFPPTTNGVIVSDDKADDFPWQIASTNGGTMGLVTNGRVASQFQVLSSILRYPGLFVCPADKVKSHAISYDSFGNSNVSYFVNVDSTKKAASANMILIGDRHLQVASNPVQPGLFVYTNGMAMSWTKELHWTSSAGAVGIVTFADAHVGRVPTSMLTNGFNQQKIASERLLVP